MKLSFKMRFCGSLVVLIIVAGCTSKKSPGLGVRILAYSSLSSKGGFLESVRGEFETKSQCSLKIETTLGASQVLSFLEEEKQRSSLDVVMGIDEIIFERAKGYLYQGDLSALKLDESRVKFIKSRTGARPGFIPLDYGVLSFIFRKADFKNGMQIPSKLQDLLLPSLKKKWIVQDPRASSPGLQFFLFTDSILRVRDLRPQWVTLAPSWDSSYKMFLAHESSMVWSYLSSIAYHASKGQGADYGYVNFKEGLPIQIEGMALLNKPGNPLKENPCIEKWIHFVLSREIQAKMVQTQWMMPVTEGVLLPQFFDSIKTSPKMAVIDLSAEKVDQLLETFQKEVQRDAP